MSKPDDIKADVENKGSDFAEKANEALKEGGAKFRATQQQAEKTYQNILDVIKDKPAASLWIILGCGLLIGKLLS